MLREEGGYIRFNYINYSTTLELNTRREQGVREVVGIGEGGEGW